MVVPGSVRLKEYGGGSGSLFGGLWEPAGELKRNGVEEILKVEMHMLFTSQSLLTRFPIDVPGFQILTRRR
jgi:hypothetical protein